MQRLAHLSAMTVLLATWALPQLATADVGLTLHSAEYKVKVKMLSGRLRTQLKATEMGYEATHRLEPTGLAKMFAKGMIEETSDFTLTDNGVLPIHYVSHDTLGKKETHAQADFDWSKRSMTGTVNDQPMTETLETLVRDRVSIQYQLMHDLLQGGGNAQYVMFDIDEFKTVDIQSIGTKQVRVPAGQFEAVGIQHQRVNSSRVTTLWCVEELGYLPVIIEQHRKGKRQMRAMLKSYQPTATIIEGRR